LDDTSPKEASMFEGNAVYVVDGSGTAFLEATGPAGAYCAADLAAGDRSRVVAR